MSRKKVKNKKTSKATAAPEKRSERKHPALFGAGKEREHLVERLSSLISAGVPIMSALAVIAEETRSKTMKKVLDWIKKDVEDGRPLWKAAEDSRLFRPHAISLIKIGEETGRLADNLALVAIQEHKDRSLRSKVRSAMMYPAFVLGLTTVIGIGIAWFILPRLANVFSRMDIDLPIITRILIDFGQYLQVNGKYVIPIFVIALGLLFFFLFIYKKTKHIGRSMLFFIPGIKSLIREVEIARFGFMLGTLLEAGIPITRSFSSLQAATQFPRYQKMYKAMQTSLEEGLSFEKAFKKYEGSRKLIPLTTQQIIISAEQSGRLASTLRTIGERAEEKTEGLTKNIAVILEPLLLVIVWLGVVGVALAVILPIYQLVGNLN